MQLPRSGSSGAAGKPTSEEEEDYFWISRTIHKRGWIVEYYPGQMLHLIGPLVPGRLLLIAPKCVSGG